MVSYWMLDELIPARNEVTTVRIATPIPTLSVTVGLPSEAAPCPLQPCYFDKWDLFADTWDCQYAMGFPVCIFKYLGVSLHNFIPIFPIS